MLELKTGAAGGLCPPPPPMSSTVYPPRWWPRWSPPAGLSCPLIHSGSLAAGLVGDWAGTTLASRLPVYTVYIHNTVWLLFYMFVAGANVVHICANKDYF